MHKVYGVIVCILEGEMSFLRQNCPVPRESWAGSELVSVAARTGGEHGRGTAGHPGVQDSPEGSSAL